MTKTEKWEELDWFEIEREVFQTQKRIEAAQTFINQWLSPLGLNLSPKKTRITHTLDEVDGQQAGFDFLGCRVQQFRVGNHAIKPYFKGVWTHIKPSRKAVSTLLLKCKETINKMGPHKKRNAIYQQRLAADKAGPIEVMIVHLNRSIRGWCGYHCYQNAKETFSQIDHELFKILWQWAKRTYPRRGHIGLVKELFKNGQLWRFSVKEGSAGKPVELLHAAEVAIEKHFPIQADRSFYDGDWAYWGTRLGKYPGLPRKVAVFLKRQKGKCYLCHGSITTEDRVLVAKELQQQQLEGIPSMRAVLLHERCDNKLSDKAVRENPFLAHPSVARCMATCTPGFEASHIP